MKIKQIDLGENFARTCLQGSRTLIITFEGGGSRETRPNADRLAWAEALIADAGWDGLFILPKRLSWYQTSDVWQFFRTMSDIGFFEDYDRVVTYGSSMGGFAALAFADLAAADKAIAYHPRSVLDPEILRWPSKLSLTLKYNRKGPRADVLTSLPAKTEVTLFVDPFGRRDKSHTDRVVNAHEKTEVFRVPFIGHSIPAFLKGSGILKKVFLDAVEDQFDPKWFYEHIRQRRENAGYHARMRKALVRRSGRGQAEGSVVQHSIGEFGTDPEEKECDPGGQ